MRADRFGTHTCDTRSESNEMGPCGKSFPCRTIRGSPHCGCPPGKSNRNFSDYNELVNPDFDHGFSELPLHVGTTPFPCIAGTLSTGIRMADAQPPRRQSHSLRVRGERGPARAPQPISKTGVMNRATTPGDIWIPAEKNSTRSAITLGHGWWHRAPRNTSTRVRRLA